MSLYASWFCNDILEILWKECNMPGCLCEYLITGILRMGLQAAVVSLARDPAIWDAFVKNEKVQELMRTRTVNLPLIGGMS